MAARSPGGPSGPGRRLAHATVVLAAVVLAGPARADAGTGRDGCGPRLWLGPALALDPAFAAASGGADWFVSAHAGVGVTAAHTFGGAGDQLAAEAGYGFANVVARGRAPASEHLRLEALGGAGLARLRFGAPGAHTELAPDLVLGAALDWRLATSWELAIELQTHVSLGERTAARNAAHTSELLIVALRWGR